MDGDGNMRGVVQVFYKISLHKYGNNYESRSTSETDLPRIAKVRYDN